MRSSFWNTVWQDKVDLLNRLWGSTAIPAACADSIDNDQDGLVDYPDDSGCDSADDDDETDPPAASDELVVTLTTASDWNSGYCADARIDNPGTAPIDWQITLEIEGTVYNLWNANYSQAGSMLTAEGVDWNNLVQAGQSVAFGFCAERSAAPPPPPPAICSNGLDNDSDGLTDFPADPGCRSADDENETDNDAPLTTEVTITSEWASGYCADVDIRNNSSATVDWVVSFDIEGVVDNLWNAHYSQDGVTVSAEGLSWNNLAPANSSISFGFCANK